MIASIWTAHVANQEADKKSFLEQLEHSSTVLGRLKQIITEKEKALENLEFSLNSYDNAGWSHKQSHINGRRAELASLKQLLP